MLLRKRSAIHEIIFSYNTVRLVRLWPNGRTLFRIFGLRDEGPRSAPAGEGDRRDAIHQRYHFKSGVLRSFFGAATACVLALVLSILNWHAPGARYLLTGSVLYLAGVVLVTVIFNVPMNQALASANPASPDGARLWASCLTNWTAWNHVRTIASLAATVLFSLALYHLTPE